jgi:GT2 family glycosyltransferase
MSGAPENKRRTAICVCTHGPLDNLSALLNALRDADLSGYNPDSMELIVVDNTPHPDTRALCDREAPSLPFGLHYTEEPEPGITSARNRAVAVALSRGADFVAFIDDDDLPRNDWLIHLLNRQAETGADLVFGTWVLGDAMPQWALDRKIFRAPDKDKRRGKDSRYGLPDSASTCNALATRQILERVAAQGPIFSDSFRHSGGEDKDFFLRARALGASFASAENSVIRRNHEPNRFTTREILRRGFKNGCSRANLARSHGDAVRRLSMFGSSLVKLLLSLVILPFCIGSRGRFNHTLYKLGKSSGVLYASFTGRSIHYYSG